MRTIFLITWSLFWASAAAYCMREYILEKRMWSRWRKTHPRKLYSSDILDELKRDCPNIDFEHQIEIEKL